MWDDLAAEYWDKRMGKEGDWFQKYVLKPAIMDLLGTIEGLKILDVGCGNGHLSRNLARAGAIVTGIDVCQRIIEKAQQYSRHDKLSIKYLHADILKPLDLETRFDRIVMNMLIQDIENHIVVLKNCKNLLCSEGELIITTRHPCFSSSRDDLGWKLLLHDSSTIMSGPSLSHLEAHQSFKGSYLKMDSYFNKKKPFVLKWEKSITVSFPRTLQDYSIALHKTGFVLTKILEPKPTIRGRHVWPQMANLLERIPHFIIFGAQHARR